MINNSKINIFWAYTEYHLLCCLNLALTSFADNDYENRIYYVKGIRRLNYELKPIEGLNGFVQSIEYTKKLAQAKLLKIEKCERFFFFQEGSILDKYLAFYLKKLGAIICLAPDGSKPYAIFNKKHETLSMIKDTVSDYVFLLKNKLILPAFFRSRYYRYGSTRIIDEVWLQQPELFNPNLNRTKGKLIQMPLFELSNMAKIAEAFGLKTENISDKEHILLYINQPLWSEKLVEYEISILLKILDVFPGITINIKLHPNTPSNTISFYRKLDRVNLIKENYPAELYISLIKKSIIISGWSTALMQYNNSNNYYYLLPMFEQLGDRILSQVKIMPLSHIKVVKSIDEINFPDN